MLRDSKSPKGSPLRASLLSARSDSACAVFASCALALGLGCSPAPSVFGLLDPVDIQTGSPVDGVAAVAVSGLERGADVLLLHGAEAAVALRYHANDFQYAVNYKNGMVPSQLLLDDLDGDGGIDGVIAYKKARKLWILRGRKEDWTLEIPPDSYLTVEEEITDVALGDVDADGQKDLLVAAGERGRVTVFKGQGGLRFSAPLTRVISYDSELTRIVIADLDGDGRSEIVAGLVQARAVAVFGGLSPLLDHPADAPRYPVGLQPDEMAAGDLDGDGRKDLVVMQRGQKRLVALNGQSPGGLGTPRSYSLALAPNELALGDLNQDGRLDIATVGTDPSGLALLISAGADRYVGGTYATVAAPRTLAIGDTNGDGWMDVLIDGGGAPWFTILRGAGSR